MIREVATDHLGAAVFATELEVLARELDGGLHRVAARGREEHAVQIAGGVRGEACGELDGRLVRERPDGEVGELLGLPTGGLGQFHATVPHLHREQARQAVEVSLAVLVVDVAALTTGDDGHLTLRTEAGEMHPQVALSCVGQGVHQISEYRRRWLR